MDLKIFFDFIDESIFGDITDPHSFYKNIKIYSGSLPDWKNAHIAIIGISEERGTLHNKGVEKAADAVRRQLYRLKKGAGAYRIVDLGNLRVGIKNEDSYLRLKEVCEVLFEHNVMPIILGGSHDMDLGQYMAYEGVNKLVSVLNIDNRLDMEATEIHGMNMHHTHKILLYEPNYLFSFANMGFQSYLNDAKVLEILEKLHFENYRLGQVHQQPEEMEPVIRLADMLSFDLSALKSSDFGACYDAQPFGLTGEEACRICWYAGMSDKLSSVGLYEYNPALDHNHQGAKVVATMVWYIVEGFYHRPDEGDFDSDKYMRYVINIKDKPYDMVFYKSKLSEKWWIEVPYPEGSGEKSKTSVVPCSYNDYLTATSGEIPQRWLMTYAKLI